MNRYAAAVATAVLTLGGLATAGPAAALENPADLTKITVASKVSIASSACRNVSVRYTAAADPGWEFWGADVEVHRNGVLKSTEFVPSTAGLQPFFYCPSLDGFGKFTFGPSIVTGYDTVNIALPNFEDATEASTWIKVAARTSLSSTRKGSKVSFTAVTTRYALSQDRWIRWKSPKLTLQRKRADGTWAPVGLVGYTSTGVAKKTITAPATATYRVLAAGNSYAWSSTSGTTRR